MITSTVRTLLPAVPEKVWETVVSPSAYGWRTDLSKVEVLDETHFVEYTKSGYATSFVVTASVPYRQWELEMENTNIKGRWTGIFRPKEEGTEIEFTESVSVKKFFLRLFAKSYLKKQQAMFLRDLTKALEP